MRWQPRQWQSALAMRLADHVICAALGSGLYAPGNDVGCSIIGSTGMHMRLVHGAGRVALSPDATLTIEDPGHGMTPEEIARIYAQMARTAGRDGGGIGLDLLARICEHLGWDLRFESEPERGTKTVLRLR